MRHIDLNVFSLRGFLFGLFLLHSTAYAQSDAYDLRCIKLGIPLVDFRKITYPDLDRFKNARSICTGDAEAERARGGYKLQQYSYEKQLKIIKCSWFSPEVVGRSEEHTSELQSLMRISYAVFCLKKKKEQNQRVI